QRILLHHPHRIVHRRRVRYRRPRRQRCLLLPRHVAHRQRNLRRASRRRSQSTALHRRKMPPHFSQIRDRRSASHQRRIQFLYIPPPCPAIQRQFHHPRPASRQPKEHDGVPLAPPQCRQNRFRRPPTLQIRNRMPAHEIFHAIDALRCRRRSRRAHHAAKS